MTKVFIDGREGTTGLRIHERLSSMGGITLLALPEGLRKDVSARRELLQEADIAFLCLPDAAAREAAALSEGGRARIIDASTAHRTAPGWAYGFPELSGAHRAKIAAGSRVAVPGCHASGFIALVYPLIRSGALAPSALLSCFSLTGYSGGGKKMIAEYEAPGRGPAYAAPRAYSTLQAHKHLPEMRAVPGLLTPPVFSPVVGDFYSGMLVTVPLHAAQLAKPMDPAALTALYAEHYAGSTLVRVLPCREETDYLAANALAGRDTMELFVAGCAERYTLCARFDNLGKGASGAAIQCMNLMLGRRETDGLVL